MPPWRDPVAISFSSFVPVPGEKKVRAIQWLAGEIGSSSKLDIAADAHTRGNLQHYCAAQNLGSRRGPIHATTHADRFAPMSL
jgi:hypothetical protein